MSTFAELGIPFPLFAAPTKQASRYVGLASCRLCGVQNQHCFALDIGCAVIQSCPNCRADNYLDCHDWKDLSCRSCSATVTFPDAMRKLKNIYICYGCLRAGKGVMAKSTEFGLVSWEQAIRGVTNGVPGLQTDEFERVLLDAAEDWYGVRVPQDHLFELLHTPGYLSWQDERWLFCCKRPMTYLGNWNDILQTANLVGNERQLFEKAFSPDDPMNEWLWESIRSGSGGVCVYIFACKHCSGFRAIWDAD